MGCGGFNKKHHHVVNFQVHEQKLVDFRDVPRGFLAVKVGNGEQQKRFVIPVSYINHPLFMELLKNGEEYGFEHRGPITLRCRVEHFLYVQRLVEEDSHFHRHQNQCLCFGG